MNDDAQTEVETEVVPPWHRFSLIAHVMSNVAALVVAFLLLGLLAGESGAYFSRETWRAVSWGDLGVNGLLIICVIAALASCSLPATWICVMIARKLKLARYWQFALLGLVAAFVVLLVFLVLAAGSSMGGMVSGGAFSGVSILLAAVGAAVALLFEIGIYLVPICVAAALTYRAVVGCADHMGCAELP